MINKSLLCLGHVINALVDKEHGKARHIPFRNSKLTFLLKDTWGGNSKTCLVATVSPSGLSQSETISTLTFAQRAKLIKNTAILNEDTCGTVEALKAEVAKLRSKLHESSSAVVEKIVESEAPSSNEDLVFSLKRRSERAEGRIAELEKQMSDETEIVNTLKRKIQEETMVRKLKERRLDYMQRKQNGTYKGPDFKCLRWNHF
jgi:kinesin family protein 15